MSPRRLCGIRLTRRIIFLREFSASQPGSGTTTPGSTNEVKSKNREGRREKEAFVPENVYDALKENRRFDSIRVCCHHR